MLSHEMWPQNRHKVQTPVKPMHQLHQYYTLQFQVHFQTSQPTQLTYIYYSTLNTLSPLLPEGDKGATQTDVTGLSHSFISPFKPFKIHSHLPWPTSSQKFPSYFQAGFSLIFSAAFQVLFICNSLSFTDKEVFSSFRNIQWNKTSSQRTFPAKPALRVPSCCSAHLHSFQTSLRSDWANGEPCYSAVCHNLKGENCIYRHLEESTFEAVT